MAAAVAAAAMAAMKAKAAMAATAANAAMVAMAAMAAMVVMAAVQTQAVHSPGMPQEFPKNSPNIPQEFLEIDFEIWGIWRNVVPFSAGTNVKRSTDGAGTSKNMFRFHGERVFA